MKGFFKFPHSSSKTTFRTEKRSVPDPFDRDKKSSAVASAADQPVTSSPAARPQLIPKSQLSKTSSSASRSPTPASNGLSKSSRPSLIKQGVKRKSETPSVRLESDSSQSSEDADSTSQAKRPKVTPAPAQTFHLSRKGTMRDKKADANGPAVSYIHGSELSTKQGSANFSEAFWNPDGTLASVDLIYPGAGRRESFVLVTPKEADAYKPLEDIVQTMSTILQYFLPRDITAKYLDTSTGSRWRVLKAYRNQDLKELKAVVAEFNQLMTRSLKSGVLHSHMDNMEILPLKGVEYILNQVYARTVSPRVELLRQYKAASDNVYGELLPPFADMIFRETKLRPASVFFDMGSGVGNVVLQAALQIGCEAHGIEMMENACAAANAQEKEFKPRCKLYGLNTGSVNLMQGNFLDDPRVPKILRKADVVLVNNQAFTPELNAKLRDLFLDLKEGARLVSLKSFVPAELNERNRNSVTAGLEVKQKAYYSNFVSWMADGGTYYIATKDSKGIERRLNEARKRRR